MSSLGLAFVASYLAIGSRCWHVVAAAASLSDCSDHDSTGRRLLVAAVLVSVVVEFQGTTADC